MLWESGWQSSSPPPANESTAHLKLRYIHLKKMNKMIPFVLVNVILFKFTFKVENSREV